MELGNDLGRARSWHTGGGEGRSSSPFSTVITLRRCLRLLLPSASNERRLGRPRFGCPLFFLAPHPNG
jgi:hypothetical protein